LSVLGYTNGAIKFIRHYGYADLERQQLVNDNTIFYMASISKIITGMALMKAVEMGKIASLDDDISQYMGYRVRNPNFPDIPIKIKYLMTHTSSLSDSGVDFSFWQDSNSPSPPSLHELLVPGGKYYNDLLWRQTPPGQGFEYSNYGAVIAGSIIGKVTGERFDVFVAKHLLQPLGIRGGFSLQSVPDINDVAVLYELDSDNTPYAVDEQYHGVRPDPFDFSKYRPGTNPTVFGPFGGLRTRVLGLERLMEVFLNNGCVKAAFKPF
jgi:CubicO group peptidase (beta-lactamase class C family)